MIGPPAPKLTDAEVKDLARRVYRNEVFTSDQVDPPDMIPNVFMVFALMKPEDQEELIEKRASLLYAKMKDAGPRSVNGLPVFFSMSWLNETDHWRFRDAYREIVKLLEPPEGSP